MKPRVSLLITALALATLSYVWRVQDLFPFLGAARLLPVSTLLVVAAVIPDSRAVSQLQQAANRPAGMALIMFTGLSAAGIAFSLWPGLSFEYFTKNLLPTALLSLAIAAAVRSIADANRIAAAIVFGAAVYATVILTTFDIGPGGRLGSLVYYDANDLGVLIVCTVPLGLYFLHVAHGFLWRILLTLVEGVFVLTIVKSGSRGAFLGLLAVLLCMLFRYRAVPVAARAAVAGTVTVVLVASAGGSYWQSIGTLMHPTADYNWIGNEEGGRMNVWRRGIGYMESRPLTGVGLAAFPVAEGTLSPLAARQDYGVGLKWSVAHNSFVQVGAELGVPGLILFLLLLLRTVKSLRDSAARGRALPTASEREVAALADALTASVAGFIVGGFFLSQGYAPFLWSLFGLAIGIDVTLRVNASQGAGRLHARRAYLVPAGAAPRARRYGGRAFIATTGGW